MYSKKYKHILKVKKNPLLYQTVFIGHSTGHWSARSEFVLTAKFPGCPSKHVTLRFVNLKKKKYEK